MSNTLRQLIEQFDRFDYYLTPKLDRDIEAHRKGQFRLCRDTTGYDNRLCDFRAVTITLE